VKKTILAIFMMISLGLSNIANAEVISAAEFQSRIEKMADVMNKFRKGSSSYYSINAIANGTLSETKVWNYTTSGYGLTPRCEISVNQNTMERLNVSDDTLAWVIGHELGHCELGHGKVMSLLNIPTDSWKDEYDADLVCKRLMQAAGYNFEIVRAEIPLILNEVASTTHPDAKSRMANITTPNNTRYYPSLIKISKN
jgi:Zn-dependent protease with chaperone function